MTPSLVIDPPRSKRLKAASHTAHQQLDARIMAAEPFRDRARYGLFLKVQHAFHRDIDALYADPRLIALVPDLPARRRLRLIERDMADLGLAVPAPSTPPAFADTSADLAAAFGWLYVAEGSNLGAAFLLKAAAAIGLDETFGARHLAGHPDGRALHWRTFTAVLDGLALDDAGEARAVAGATAAFRRVRSVVDDVFA